ncbi:POP4 isoform 6 [Pan troglodytes]|uniref:POP4 homolog, ribonuclease P/MRP subunit n=2 Tax=Homininae TaxID=207598 RepID=K7EK50_HUMAN|nr:POP4 isoform 6 [Pan troglodytes]
MKSVIYHALSQKEANDSDVQVSSWQGVQEQQSLQEHSGPRPS